MGDGRELDLDRRHEFFNQLRQFDLFRVRRAEARARERRLADRFDDAFVGVPDDHRPPRTDVIDKFIAVDVPHFRALRFRDIKRIASDRFKRSDRRIDAARHMFLCFFE